MLPCHRPHRSISDLSISPPEHEPLCLVFLAPHFYHRGMANSSIFYCSIAVVQGSFFFFFCNILIRMVTDVINCYILESRSSEFATTIGGWLQIGRALETAALQAVALWFPKAGLRPGPGLGWYLSWSVVTWENKKRTRKGVFHKVNFIQLKGTTFYAKICLSPFFVLKCTFSNHIFIASIV